IRRMPSLMQHSSASSIGPPMMKNRSLTPCAFRQRARISLPVISAMWVSSPGLWGNEKQRAARCRAAPTHDPQASTILLAEHLFGPQLLDLAAAQIEPAGEHLLGVLAELRRGL